LLQNGNIEDSTAKESKNSAQTGPEWVLKLSLRLVRRAVSNF